MKSLEEKIEEIEKLILPCNFPIHHSTEECTGQTVHLAWRKIEPAIKSLINQQIIATLDKVKPGKDSRGLGGNSKSFWGGYNTCIDDLEAKIAKIKKDRSI